MEVHTPSFSILLLALVTSHSVQRITTADTFGLNDFSAVSKF